MLVLLCGCLYFPKGAIWNLRNAVWAPLRIHLALFGGSRCWYIHIFLHVCVFVGLSWNFLMCSSYCWIGCSVKAVETSGRKNGQTWRVSFSAITYLENSDELIRDSCSFIIKCGFNTHADFTGYFILDFGSLELAGLKEKAWQLPKMSWISHQKISVLCTIIRSIELILPRKAEYFACRLCQNANFMCAGNREQSNTNKYHKMVV